MFVVVKNQKTGNYFIWSKRAWQKSGFVRVFEGTHAECIEKIKELSKSVNVT